MRRAERCVSPARDEPSSRSVSHLMLNLLQIDGSAQFTFHVPDYVLDRRSFFPDMSTDEFLMIVAQVTEDLTGTRTRSEALTSEPSATHTELSCIVRTRTKSLF